MPCFAPHAVTMWTKGLPQTPPAHPFAPCSLLKDCTFKTHPPRSGPCLHRECLAPGSCTLHSLPPGSQVGRTHWRGSCLPQGLCTDCFHPGSSLPHHPTAGPFYPEAKNVTASAGGCKSVVQHALSMHEALALIPSIKMKSVPKRPLGLPI